MKQLKYLIIVAMAAGLLLMTTATAAAENETLTIKGDGVGKEITYSRAELEAMKDNIVQYCYSGANNFPTEKIKYAEGVPLTYLLEKAGIKDTAQVIRFAASDGYVREFTVQELLYTPRYNFTKAGEKQEVPAMVCLKSSESGFDKLEAEDMRLVIGQRAQSEQTDPWFVKFLSEIIVSCEEPGQWPAVTFNRVSGDDGVTLQLLHKNFDSVKIYYTTDGSDPTVESKMYNVSASYYQPELNKPLLINRTTVVKAVVVGPGMENSQVASITVSFEGAVFSDLAGYDWARPAIEALAEKGIVNGVGDYRFDPAGGLTRGMFVTMMGRALGDKTEGEAAVEGLGFPDVEDSSWYGPYVKWAVGEGIVNGYPDGTFKPNNFLTVEEMNIMAARASGKELEKANPGATDVKKKASRAEAAVVLYSLMP